MNMVGNIGSATSAIIFPFFVSSITIPFLAEKSGTANSFFIFAAILNIIALFSWMFMNPEKKFDTSVSKETIRLRLTLIIVTFILVFIGVFIYKTFFMN